MNDLVNSKLQHGRSTKGTRNKTASKAKSFTVRSNGVVRVNPKKLLKDSAFKKETTSALKANLSKRD